MSYIGLFLVGIISWPLLEYLLHRFSGHIIRFPKAFFSEHQAHHAKRDYFAPAWKKLAAAVIVLSILTFGNSLWLDKIRAFVFSVGFVLMYLFYEWAHYSFHKFAPKTKLGLRLRKHHFSHHYINPKMNFGVTTIFFDHLFKTIVIPKKVPVPKSFAMDWLKDDKSNQWHSDFEIKS